MINLALIATLQIPLFNEPHRAWPYVELGTGSIEFGDMDGDGDIDAVGTVHDFAPPGTGAANLYRNDGQGTFTLDETAFATATGSARDAVLADLDLDGDLDVALARTDLSFLSPGATNLTAVNDGAGAFTITNLAGPVGLSNGVDASDVDSDGDIDLVFTNSNVANELYLNLGNATFSDASSALVPPNATARDVVFADVNGDGFEDLFIVGDNGFHQLQIADGLGGFSDASGQFPLKIETTRAAAAADLDSDGDIDLVVPGSVYLNDGSGTFTLGASGSSPGSQWQSDVALADVDNDGDVDAIYPQSGVFINDGAAAFTYSSDGLVSSGSGQRRVAAADLDGDGDIDVVVGRDDTDGLPIEYRRSDMLFYNDGAGVFTDATLQQPRLPQVLKTRQSIASGDLDGDGDIDAVTGAIYGSFPIGYSKLLTLYSNDGTGQFSDNSALIPETDLQPSVTRLADADNDGDLDIFNGGLSEDYGGVEIYINSGSNDFVSAPMKWLGGGSSFLTFELGDLNGDGNLDGMTGADATNYPFSKTSVHLGDGTGSFSSDASRFEAVPEASPFVGFGDLDNDGDLDVFLGNRKGFGPFGEPKPLGQDQVYLNDGIGGLTLVASALPVEEIAAKGGALADVDDDGDLDAWVTQSEGDVLYRNNGSASFVAENPIGTFGGSTEIALIDFDLDGDLDALASGGLGLYLNDGLGGFANVAGALPAGYVGTSRHTVADFDGDGDPDVMFPTRSGVSLTLSSSPNDADRIWLNRTRHVGWNRSASIGKSFDVELCHDDATFTALWYSTSVAQLTLPEGTIWLDLANAAQLQAGTLPSGCTTLGIDIPDNSGFVGVDVFLQAVVIPLSTPELRFSNLEPVQITDL